MSDEVFKQSRRRITPEEIQHNDQAEGNPLDHIRSVQDAVAKEVGKEAVRPMDQAPFQISGKSIPPAFLDALQRQKANPVVPESADPVEDEGFETFEAPPERPKKAAPKKEMRPRVVGSDQYENLLQRLAEKHQQWEEFHFPSQGKFYTDIPSVIHVRAMTGEEEQILATPRFVRKGSAIDMIFRRCIRESINTEDLLSIDRTHLLIFLRGISYTPEYDVEIKCTNCSIKFAHVVNLDELEVRSCPSDFDSESLSGELPVSGFSYRYRLATGSDEREISAYREKRIANWGDQGEDDTLLYRTALLLEEIEGVMMKKELAMLLKKLPISDVAHLRNEINQPPFGVDTELPILCPNCNEEFKIDLPLETNFFFPRKKNARTQA